MLTIGIVSVLTLGLTALAVHLHVGIPHANGTQIADLAETAVGSVGLFAFFQLSSSLLAVNLARGCPLIAIVVIAHQPLLPTEGRSL